MRKEEAMRIIEPCCYHKQLEGLIDECMQSQKAVHFFSYSDWDIHQLLGLLSGYLQGGELHLALVRLDVKTISTLRKLLNRIYPDPAQPQNHIPVITKMVLVTQPASAGAAFNQRAELREQLGRFIQDGRLTVCEDNIGFRCIALRSCGKNLVIQGSLNLELSGAMQMFTLTTTGEAYEEVAEMFQSKARTKKLFKNSETSEKP